MSDIFDLENYADENDVVVEAEAVEEIELEESTIVEEAVEEAAPEVAEEVISSPEPVEDTTPALAPVENGVMGSSSVKKKSAKKSTKKAADEPKPEKVAVFSTRNVTWPGVGKVYRGYNIVTVEQSEKWLQRDHIRLATPEEFAKEFGN